jgi:hypothetical protein
MGVLTLVLGAALLLWSHVSHPPKLLPAVSSSGRASAAVLATALPQLAAVCPVMPADHLVHPPSHLHGKLGAASATDVTCGAGPALVNKRPPRSLTCFAACSLTFSIAVAVHVVERGGHE